MRQAGVVNLLQVADAAAQTHASRLLALLAGSLPPGVLESHIAGCYGVLGKGRHAALHGRGEPVGGVPLAVGIATGHDAGDGAGQFLPPGSGLPRGDARDARLSGKKSGPGPPDADSEGRDGPEASHDDATHACLAMSRLWGTLTSGANRASVPAQTNALTLLCTVRKRCVSRQEQNMRGLIAQNRLQLLVIL